ncbi:hypothetical protein RIF29_21056 [Crotalaria pallida]|uniref:Peroxin-7 n=1 Tax=Crotalaria pallida TaxID=3830 RepID=A0AAN9I5L6_CROPI
MKPVVNLAIELVALQKLEPSLLRWTWTNLLSITACLLFTHTSQFLRLQNLCLECFCGSLVHSLTGHTESTYVPDVHPFNPWIAMSAGYDGRTIVWDIWEGMPIRIYETSCFKLADEYGFSNIKIM